MQRQKKGKKAHRPDTALVSVPREMMRDQRQNRVVKRVLASSGTASTGAGGYLGVLNICNSGQVNATTFWSSYSNTALEYRVLAVEVLFTPIVSATTGFTTPPPCQVFSCVWSSGLSPSTYAGVLQAPSGMVHCGQKPFRVAASAKGFPDALLWTPTSGTPGSGYTYGVTIADASLPPAGPVSQVVLRYVVKFLVEFRSLD